MLDALLQPHPLMAITKIHHSRRIHVSTERLDYFVRVSNQKNVEMILEHVDIDTLQMIRHVLEKDM